LQRTLSWEGESSHDTFAASCSLNCVDIEHRELPVRFVQTNRRISCLIGLVSEQLQSHPIHTIYKNPGVSAGSYQSSYKIVFTLSSFRRLRFTRHTTARTELPGVMLDS
jgi:hypothetical protein